MSLLDRFKSEKNAGPFKNWKNLTQLSQLDQIKDDSFQKPIVLFKHSTTCGISAGAKYRLQEPWDFKEEIDFYYLDLLSFREISNKIAEQFGVTHQSPQIIIIAMGEVTFHTSHHNINFEKLKAAVNEVIMK